MGRLERESGSEGAVGALLAKIESSPASEKHSRQFQEDFTVGLVAALLARPTQLREMPVFLENVVKLVPSLAVLAISGYSHASAL